MNDRAPDRVTLAAFVLAVLFAGANGLAIGFSNDELAPYWGATLRFLAAGLVCAAIVVVRRYPIPRGRALLGMALYGVLAIAFAFGLLYWALVEVPTGVGVVILALVPLLTLMLAVIQRVEPFRWLAVIGALVAATGVAIISADQLAGRVPPLPMLAVLVAAAAIAQSSVRHGWRVRRGGGRGSAWRRLTCLFVRRTRGCPRAPRPGSRCVDTQVI